MIVGMIVDEMVGWHHPLNGYEFEQALGDGEGQGGLVFFRTPCASYKVPMSHFIPDFNLCNSASTLFRY